MHTDQKVAVIVPTRHESGNIDELHVQLDTALAGWDWRVVFVDDSDDETPDVIHDLRLSDARVHLIHRVPDERSGGLGGAVLAGFSHMGGWADVLVVMDADLQHPPTVIPRLVDALVERWADVAVASRYLGDGGADGLDGPLRRWVSSGSRRLTHRLLKRSRSVSDPLSGYFAVRPHVIEGIDLRPDGYKVLLELLVRGRWLRVTEIPYQFAARHDGRSKSSLTEGVRFGRHLVALRRPVAPTDPGPQKIPASPMRVLILTSEAPPVMSGVARSVATLKAGLEGRGHHVDIVSRADFPRMLRREIRVSSFGFFWPRFRRRLAGYDVVNVHGPVPTITEIFLSLMRTLPGHRKPGVVYTHHSDLAIPGLSRPCRWYNKLIERLAHTADSIVVTSTDYRDKLTRHDGAPLHLIPWAVASQAPSYPRIAGRPGVLRVLFVGQLRPYKGLLTLLSAVADAPDLQVTIVGDGPMRVELQERIDREGLANVRMLGRVDDEALWRTYAASDAIVLPSTTTAEAFGLVLIEGMSSGCVPIASDLPGVREVAGPSGIVTTPGDVSELRSALRELAADPQRLAAMSEAALAQARLRGVEVMVESYERVLRVAAVRVAARQSRAVTPTAYPDPHAFLRDINSRLGSTRASLSLVDLTGEQHARVWLPEHGDALIREAPVATYVARSRRPVLITGQTGEPALVPMLRREELSSSLLVPFKVGRSTIAVLGISTDHASDLVLDQAHLADTIDLVSKIRPHASGSQRWRTGAA